MGHKVYSHQSLFNIGESTMPNGFQQPITIKEAINNIDSRKYLLPAIQREFVWSDEQIELLFDSILRDYPINSFMSWKISDEEIKTNYKFYQFIQEYREWFQKENPHIDTVGFADFEAIVDGQQRLTSLYIGLKGSYAYKLPRKWWVNNEENIPTRYLFLNLSSKLTSEIDNTKEYEFKFLRNRQESFTDDNGIYWFRLRDVINLTTLSSVMNYINVRGLGSNVFAQETLAKLFQKIHNEKLINIYVHEDNDPDKILDIFLRTNSGGTPLSFSDLLMSISSANWQRIDARKALSELVDEVNTLGNPSFRISRDFILKTGLVLFSDDIRFQLKNFTLAMVNKIEDNWDKMRKAIVSAFQLFTQLGFNDTNFRAKNAAIPIIYYIFHHNLEEEIVKSIYPRDEKKTIGKWLTLSFLRGIFGGQTDQVLTKIRKALIESNVGNEFPFNDLISAFDSDATRNYTFDQSFVDNLVYSEYGTSDCDYVLYLLYPDKIANSIHRDHMHPKSFFENQELVENIGSEIAKQYAQDKKNWNTVLNLQLLDSIQNTHKTNQTLLEWSEEQSITKEQLLIGNDIDLSMDSFDKFVESRKSKIVNILMSII